MPDRKQTLKEWLDQEPSSDMETLLGDLKRAHDLFLQEVAARLEKPFNQHIGSLPCTTFADKLKIIDYVRSELAALSLCIASPESRKPASLVGSNIGPNGRFQLRHLRKQSDAERVCRSSSALPYLLLRPGLPDARMRSRHVRGDSSRSDDDIAR